MAADELLLPTKQETQLELILITLRNLIEEIKLFNASLSEKRRRAMNAALTAALPDILTFFQKFIHAQYQRYLQASMFLNSFVSLSLSLSQSD